MGKETTISDLGDIIKNHNSTLPVDAKPILKSGKKSQLVQHILENEMQIAVPSGSDETPLIVKLIQTWMLQPFKGTAATYTGLHNEAKVRKHIPAFVASNSGVYG